MDYVKLRHYKPTDLTILTVPRHIAKNFRSKDIELMKIIQDGDRLIFEPIRA